jgi:hypothetical protein
LGERGSVAAIALQRGEIKEVADQAKSIPINESKLEMPLDGH